MIKPSLARAQLLDIYRVFHDPLVSLNFEGFDPQFFLNDPQNLLFTFYNSYVGGHCDPLNRKLRENPVFMKKFDFKPHIPNVNKSS